MDLKEAIDNSGGENELNRFICIARKPLNGELLIMENSHNKERMLIFLTRNPKNEKLPEFIEVDSFYEFMDNYVADYENLPE